MTPTFVCPRSYLNAYNLKKISIFAQKQVKS